MGSFAVQQWPLSKPIDQLLPFGRAEHGVEPAFIVPSGNVGNATAALWARALGLPIRGITMVANANRTVPDFFATGEWRPRPSVQTLANAMDVGAPSNMERVFDLYPDRDALRATVRSLSVPDDETVQAQRRLAHQGFYVEPTSALAVAALDRLHAGAPPGAPLQGTIVVILTGSGFKSPPP